MTLKTDRDGATSEGSREDRKSSRPPAKDDYLSFFAPFKAGGGSSKGSPLAFAAWRRRYQASQSWCAAALPLSSPSALPSALLRAAIFARLALNL